MNYVEASSGDHGYIIQQSHLTSFLNSGWCPSCLSSLSVSYSYKAMITHAHVACTCCNYNSLLTFHSRYSLVDKESMRACPPDVLVLNADPEKGITLLRSAFACACNAMPSILSLKHTNVLLTLNRYNHCIQ